MLKVFSVKRGSTFSFIITFKNLNQDVTTMNFGVKEDYTDESLVINKTIGDGITKIGKGRLFYLRYFTVGSWNVCL